MKKILFVDDEPRILDALRRALRSRRHEWDMHFASGGQQALELIRQSDFDVVVTDMKMPGVDGAELLDEVRGLSPRTIRIILSGHADTAAVIAAAAQVHLYLAKPCDPAEIQHAVDRTDWLEHLLDSQPIAEIATGLTILPSCPNIHAELCKRLAADKYFPADIAAIIGRDVGMSLAVLKLVNSAFFGQACSVTSVERAVSLLGTDTLKQLVLEQQLCQPCAGDAAHLKGIRMLNEHSGLTARIARRIAEFHNLHKAEIEVCVTSAMLHDTGTLIVAARMPHAYGQLYQATAGTVAHDAQLERNLFGATRAEIGAYVIGLWGLPDEVVTAVAFHENPRKDSAGTFDLAGIIHVAKRLARAPDAVDPRDEALDLDVDYLQAAGVLEHWPNWLTAARACLSARPAQSETLRIR